MKIAILGAGAFGTTLGGVLAEKGYDIDYYDSKVERERLSDVLKGAIYIVLTVPSKAVPYVLPQPSQRVTAGIFCGVLGLHGLVGTGVRGRYSGA